MWLRLDRAGNTFTAYQSADGATWTKIGSTVTIPMSATAFVGLAVTSHNVDATSTSVIDHVTINGSPTCVYTVAPGGLPVAGAGGNATFGVTTSSACTWTAASSDTSWLTVAPGPGAGNATVTATAAANAGAARSATMTVAGQAFTVSQAPAACTYTLSPGSQSLAVGGDTAMIGVTAGSWCSWTANSSDPSWLTVTSGASGSGNGTVTLSGAANAAGPRAASVTIGDQTFSASQGAAACSYAIAPASQSPGAGGGTMTVAVTTGSWCSWSASSGDPTWLNVLSGASGTGNGSVAISAAANAAGARTATVAIGGQVFTASQTAAACTYAISPSSASLANGGDTASFAIMTGSWCSWTAAAGDPSWLTIASAASGSGNGQVTVTAPQNAAGARSTTVSIGGQNATVSQAAAPCSYVISPGAQSMAAGGDTATVAVITSSWCTWTSASNAPSWLTVTAGASGTANGSVTIAAAPNNGPARTASVTIADQTFTASQSAAACTYAISPGSQSLAAGGDSATVAITTGSWCSWTASTSDPSWLTIASAASGSGSGTVSLSAAPNGAGSRAATATIGGQTFTASQAPAACSYTISPASQAFSPGGDTGSFAVATGSWCSWTASSSAPWLTIAGGASGAGNGTVSLNAAANTAAARTASVTVAGQVFSGSQAAASAPAGWANQDIGAVGAAGGSSVSSSGGISVTGAGADVWGTADALQFAYQPLTGDGSIVARVASIQNVNAWTKAGVMIRETADPGSRQAFMLVSFGNGLAFQRRTGTNGSSTSTTSVAATAPYWVRLDRAGNMISAYQSADGVTWALVDTDTLAMGANVLIGLGVSSHTTTATATATFDQVSITSGTPATPTPLPTGWSQQDIGSVGIVGSGAFNAGAGTFVAKGSGADIWGTVDAFHFVYKPMSGDGVIVARVATIQNTNAWAKAGVMIRETLATGSTHALMLASASKGSLFERRVATKGVTTSTAGPATAPPLWVKLERIGNTFNAYTSTDGVTWLLVGSDTVVMAPNVYVGFAVSSHTATAVAQATFDNVSTP
jgi:regulation of enolase protein 1 (concanavalin A-like superfamily)